MKSKADFGRISLKIHSPPSSPPLKANPQIKRPPPPNKCDDAWDEATVHNLLNVLFTFKQPNSYTLRIVAAP